MPGRAACGLNSGALGYRSGGEVITSFDTFDQLYTQRRLDRAAVADRLVGLAERALCPPA